MMRESKPSNRGSRFVRLAVIAILVLAACSLTYFTSIGLEDVVAAEPATSWGDAGRQRRELLKAQRETNEKLDEIIKLLTSGKVRVQTTSDEAGGSHETTTQPHGS